jgi:hypothetical protein
MLSFEGARGAAGAAPLPACIEADVESIRMKLHTVAMVRIESSCVHSVQQNTGRYHRAVVNAPLQRP